MSQETERGREVTHSQLASVDFLFQLQLRSHLSYITFFTEVTRKNMTTVQGQVPVLEEYIPESSPYDHMEAMKMEESNILDRVSNLPLIANTWDAVSAYYTATKKSYPSVTPYLEVAEKLTTGAACVALATTKPVIDKLAPTVNSYANRGLDKLEDALPMIHDQPDEIYDATKAAVASLVTRKIDSALSVTESYVDYYLPPEEDEDVESSDDEPDSDDESDASTVMENPELASPKERIVVMTHKVRERAYHRAMDKIHGVRKRSLKTLNRLKFTVDLIQYAKEEIDNTRGTLMMTVSCANGTIRDSVTSSKENVANVWKEIRSRSSDAAAELRVLERAQALTGQLQTACGTVLSVLSGIPKYEYLRAKVLEAKESADALAKSLVGITSISELSTSVTAIARTQIEHFGKVLEALFDLVVEKAPLSWLALDFNSDPFEGLFMQDLEAELRLNINPANNAAPLEDQRSNHVRYRRG